MDLEISFAEEGPTPRINPNVATSTTKWLEGLQHIRIDRREADGDEKINMIRCTGTEPGQPPKEPEDALNEMVMRICIDHYESCGEPGKYRMQYTFADKRGKATRKYCTIAVPGMNGAASRAMPELLDQEQAWAQERTGLNHTIDTLTSYNLALTEKLLSMAASKEGMHAPMLQVINTLVGKYDEGLRMVSAGLRDKAEAGFEVERIKQEGENSREMWKSIRKPLAAVGEQLGVHIPKMLGLGDVADGDDDDDDDDDDETTETGTNGAEVIDTTASERPVKKGKKGKKAAAQDPNRKAPGDPNTVLLRSIDGLLMGFTPQQWFELKDGLTRKMFETLQCAHTSKSDVDAAVKMEELQTRLMRDLPRAKMLKKCLTDEQFDALSKVTAYAEKVTEEHEQQASA